MTQKKVCVTHENPDTHCVKVLKRFAGIEQAEKWLAEKIQVKDPVGLKAGHYGIDAPEKLVNPRAVSKKELAVKINYKQLLEWTSVDTIFDSLCAQRGYAYNKLSVKERRAYNDSEQSRYIVRKMALYSERCYVCLQAQIKKCKSTEDYFKLNEALKNRLHHHGKEYLAALQ